MYSKIITENRIRKLVFKILLKLALFTTYRYTYQYFFLHRYFGVTFYTGMSRYTKNIVKPIFWYGDFGIFNIQVFLIF